MERVAFTYWSDPLCVWAFVAQPRLDRILEEYRAQLDVSYRVVPVFGSVVQRFRDGKWAAAGPEGRAETTRRVAARFGRDDVSGAVWTRDAPASSWPVGAAIKAAFALEEAGSAPPGAGAQYQLRLREAFFVEDRNVARRREQLAIAEACGLPTAGLEARIDDGTALAALWEDYEAKEALRLQGSPTWVFDAGRAMLYGNVGEAVIHATVDELVRGLGPGSSRC